MKCKCREEIRIITYHKLTLKFQTIDGINRLHLTCKDCYKSICMKGDLKDYRENQIIEEYCGGEL